MSEHEEKWRAYRDDKRIIDLAVVLACCLIGYAVFRIAAWVDEKWFAARDLTVFALAAGFLGFLLAAVFLESAGNTLYRAACEGLDYNCYNRGVGGPAKWIVAAPLLALFASAPILSVYEWWHQYDGIPVESGLLGDYELEDAADPSIGLSLHSHAVSISIRYPGELAKQSEYWEIERTVMTGSGISVEPAASSDYWPIYVKPAGGGNAIELSHEDPTIDGYYVRKRNRNASRTVGAAREDWPTVAAWGVALAAACAGGVFYWKRRP